MADETLLVALFGGLHLLGFAFAAILLLPCLRDESLPSAGADEEDGGGGGNDRLLPSAPRGPRPGGIPLPDAAQSRVRLREPGTRLADALPPAERRPAHAPSPARTPERVAARPR